MLKDENKKEFAERVKLDELPVGKPNKSGIYFLFHQNKLIYLGAARNIQQHHQLRYLLKNYPQETLEIRYLEQPGDWEELVKLENYLSQIHSPELKQTVVKTEDKESNKLKL